MSCKTKPYNRVRNKTVIYKITKEEDMRINALVKLSGLTKTEYFLRRAEKKEIKVFASSRVHKALRTTLDDINLQLAALTETGKQPDEHILELIKVTSQMIYEMKGEF